MTKAALSLSSIVIVSQMIW